MKKSPSFIKMVEALENITPAVEENPKVVEEKIRMMKETNGHALKSDDVAENGDNKSENGKSEALSDETKAENSRVTRQAVPTNPALLTFIRFFNYNWIIGMFLPSLIA